VIEYAEHELDDVPDAIDTAGYGLTLGVHSRIDARVDRICAQPGSATSTSIETRSAR